MLENIQRFYSIWTSGMNETQNCYWMRLVVISLNLLVDNRQSTVCNVAQAKDDMVDNIKVTLVGNWMLLPHLCSIGRKECLGSNTLPASMCSQQGSALK